MHGGRRPGGHGQPGDPRSTHTNDQRSATGTSILLHRDPPVAEKFDRWAEGPVAALLGATSQPLSSHLELASPACRAAMQAPHPLRRATEQARRRSEAVA